MGPTGRVSGRGWPISRGQGWTLYVSLARSCPQNLAPMTKKRGVCRKEVENPLEMRKETEDPLGPMAEKQRHACSLENQEM